MRISSSYLLFACWVMMLAYFLPVDIFFALTFPKKTLSAVQPECQTASYADPESFVKGSTTLTTFFVSFFFVVVE